MLLNNNRWALFLFVVIGLFSRLIPHPPDATALTALCLLSPRIFSKHMAFVMMICILLASDWLLHFILRIPLFGSWTLFTYSGWLLIVLLGFALKKQDSMMRNIGFATLATTCFWIWTNFGTWLCSMMYAHTPMGLLNCYSAALPFLKNSLISTDVLVLLMTTRFGQRETCQVTGHSTH